MALLSQKELNELLNEVHQSTQHYNIPGDTASVRSIGGLGPAQSVAGSNAAASAGGQVSGFAAMTALLTSIAQDMRTIAQIMTGSGGAGASVGGGASAMVNSMQSRNNPQQGPLATQMTPRVDAGGHVIPPSVDGAPNYMLRVAERATYQGGLQPHSMAWDAIGYGAAWGRSQMTQGAALTSQGNALYDQGAAMRSTAAGWDMMEQGRAMSVTGSGMLPLGRAALGVSAFAGAALFVGMETQKAWMAQTQPLHELNVQVTKAEAAGQYVNTVQLGLMREAQGMQGKLDASRSWGGMIDWLPMVGAERMHGYRIQELNIAKVQGQAESVMARNAIGAFSSDANRAYINSYDYNGTLEVSQGLSRTLRQFGAGVTDNISTSKETAYLRGLMDKSFTSGDIVEPVERMRAMASEPGGAAMKAFLESQGDNSAKDLADTAKLKARSVDLKNKITNNQKWLREHGFGKDTDDVIAMQAEAARIDAQIGAGPVRSKAMLQRDAQYQAELGRTDLVGLSPEKTPDTTALGESQLGYQSEQFFAGAESARLGGSIRSLMAQGAGYQAVNAVRSEQVQQANINAAAIRNELANVNLNPKRRAILAAKLSNAEAEGFEGIQANTFYQNSQESMFFGAAEQTAQIATTRGLYGPGSLGGFQRGIGGQISAVGDTAANLRQQAQRPGIDPGTQVSLLAQAAQKDLEQSVLLPRQLTTGTMALEDQAMEARRRSAAVTTGKAYYGGDIAGFDIGIAGEIELSKENAKKERRQAQYLMQTDPERALHESAAKEEDIKQIGLYRRSAETHFATSMSYASGLQQQAGAQMTVAQLIGGGKEAYEAATKSVEAFGVQIQAITDRLAAGGLGPEEVAAKMGERTALVTQQHAAELQRGRSYEEATVSIAGSQAAGAKSIAAGAFARGLGGPAAGGVTAGMMRGAENEYIAAKALLDKLGQQAQADGIPLSDSVPYQNQLSVVQAADTNRALTSNDIAANTPLSIGSRRAESAGAFNLQVLTSTYTPFGNVRGALAGQMGIYGQQLRELNALERQQRGRGELTEEGAFAYQQRRQEVGGKLIGAQQQYEQGFMDRIIAATYNAPSSFKGIASQFTMREAAPFMQAMGTNWGFTDANQRDNMMFRYPRLAHSITGMPGSEGFIAAAMGGLGGMYGHTGDGHVTPGGGILKGGGSMGVQTIRVIVEVVEKGTKIGVQDSTHILSNMQNTLNVTLPAVQRPGVHN